jgi:methionyl-tRNA synthetase
MPLYDSLDLRRIEGKVLRDHPVLIRAEGRKAEYIHEFHQRNGNPAWDACNSGSCMSFPDHEFIRFFERGLTRYSPLCSNIDQKCPIHEKTLENLKEPSYFFKLSKYQDFLLDYYDKNPDFILPKKRAQEVKNRVKEGLKDLSISRTSFDWGIPFPFDKKHVSFVWVDALFNYYSATQSEKKLNKFWPANIHLIGKDIIWFHTVYWPALLKAINLPLPKTVFAHGWWTVNNKKMGKSAGNAIKINKLIEIAGVDSARYFLLRETPLGDDGDFSEETLIERNNTELDGVNIFRLIMMEKRVC